ncbi:PDZ domain-containing protein [uncultured Piscinibacter sp.]|uniref:PDZ domain-containing protein n=1 Tax=uncultured Piscinibacter sp. TaxID=1131835 RepID=UPI002617BE7C|nr:PDZ domain-containing protein [uncultured Piscinibacter sp.]
MLLALLMYPVAVTADPARGIFGVTVAISGEGWFHPTVRASKVTAVRPGLAAHRAGVAAGDEVLELDGKRIPGATAKDLAPLAQGKRVGERISVRLLRPDGTSYTVILTAEQAAQ